MTLHSRYATASVAGCRVYNGSMKTNIRKHTFTYNAQQIEVIFANGLPDSYDAVAVSDYKNRAGFSVGRCGFGGYDDGAIIMAHTRTLANMIHRFMRENNIPLAKMQGD